MLSPRFFYLSHLSVYIGNNSKKSAFRSWHGYAPPCSLAGLSSANKRSCSTLSFFSIAYALSWHPVNVQSLALMMAAMYLFLNSTYTWSQVMTSHPRIYVLGLNLLYRCGYGILNVWFIYLELPS